MFGRKRKEKEERATYDPEKYKPVLRCSICTGEMVAGFKDRSNGKFIELDLIKNDEDLKKFMEKHRVDSVEKIY